MSSTDFNPDHTVATKYWHKIQNDRVQCDLCPRFCKLREGQRGLCFIRANQGGKVVLTSYGLSSGFCIDPIEKKPLNHFLPGTPVLSFGTAGCNLSCKFCQNWDISKSRETDTLAAYASARQIADSARELGCRSVAFTYNDPVIFHEYALDVARACHEQSIRCVAVTAGYVCPEPRSEFYQLMDAANIDLKAFSDEFYVQMTGSHLAPVLDTLIYLRHETEVWFEITTLLIPGKNDSIQEIDAMTKWVVKELGSDIPMHFTAYHPDYKLQDISATPLFSLNRARDIAIHNGVRYAYTGNAHNIPGESTWCHHCGNILIERNRYALSAWNLDQPGQCRHCETACSGVFEPSPGHWGARRQPVTI
jgi:pyruvate formate lyase activating enzyme